MNPLLTHRNNLSYFARQSPPRHSATNPQGGVIRNWMRALIRNWKRRKMIATLQALDDRLLRDIGITRSEINAVVDGFDDRELSMAPMVPAAQTAAPAHHNSYQKAA